jgi:hypothetical protein
MATKNGQQTPAWMPAFGPKFDPSLGSNDVPQTRPTSSGSLPPSRGTGGREDIIVK